LTNTVDSAHTLVGIGQSIEAKLLLSDKASSKLTETSDSD